MQNNLNPNSEAGLSVAATPRRRKVQAMPSSPVAAAIIPLPGKMRRGRRYHPVATRRRRSFRPAASENGLVVSSFAPVYLLVLVQGQFLGHQLGLAPEGPHWLRLANPTPRCSARG